MYMKNNLKKIINLFESTKLPYYLIRPIDFNNLEDLTDIDITMNYKDILSLLEYLNANKIVYYCEHCYTFNKLLLKIYNFYIDIDININSFTPHKLISIKNNIKSLDYECYENIKIPILSEPYLFINWTLHYILDKRSFSKGDSYIKYKQKYKKIYMLLLNNKRTEEILKEIYLDKTNDVLSILKISLFQTEEILKESDITYLYNLSFFKQKLKLKKITARIKFAIERRMDKYVFRKSKQYTNCIGKICLFSK